MHLFVFEQVTRPREATSKSKTTSKYLKLDCPNLLNNYKYGQTMKYFNQFDSTSHFSNKMFSSKLILILSLTFLWANLASECNGALYFYHQKSVSGIKSVWKSKKKYNNLSILGTLCPRFVSNCKSKNFSLCNGQNFHWSTTSCQNLQSMEKSRFGIKIFNPTKVEKVWR